MFAALMEAEAVKSAWRGDLYDQAGQIDHAACMGVLAKRATAGGSGR